MAQPQQQQSDRLKFQKKKIKAEQDVKKSVIFKVIGAEKTLENINNEIDEITTAYENVHGNVKDSKLLRDDVKEVAKAFNETNFRKLDSTIKFAEDNQKLVGKDVLVAESDVDAQAFHDMAVQEHNEKIDLKHLLNFYPQIVCFL